ncbi:hypothetical protein BDV19DRAFT_384721 [Aspergillus venezuelensis]
MAAEKLCDQVKTNVYDACLGVCPFDGRGVRVICDAKGFIGFQIYYDYILAGHSVKNSTSPATWVPPILVYDPPGCCAMDVTLKKVEEVVGVFEESRLIDLDLRGFGVLEPLTGPRPSDSREFADRRRYGEGIAYFDRPIWDLVLVFTQRLMAHLGSICLCLSESPATPQTFQSLLVDQIQLQWLPGSACEDSKKPSETQSRKSSKTRSTVQAAPAPMKRPTQNPEPIDNIDTPRAPNCGCKDGKPPASDPGALPIFFGFHQGCDGNFYAQWGRYGQGIDFFWWLIWLEKPPVEGAYRVASKDDLWQMTSLGSAMKDFPPKVGEQAEGIYFSEDDRLLKIGIGKVREVTFMQCPMGFTTHDEV